MPQTTKAEHASPDLSGKAARTAGENDLTELLGRELRTHRIEAGIGLRGLAREIGVSASFLSQIERGKSAPSVATLYAITSRLNISLDELFLAAERGDRAGSEAGRRPPSWEAPSDGPVLRAGNRLRLSLAEGVIWERLTASDDADLDFVFCSYLGGAESAPEDRPIAHQGHEYGLVLAGRCGATVGDDTYFLQPGDSITFDAGIAHRIWNLDAIETMTLVWIVVGRRHDSRFDVPDPRGRSSQPAVQP